MQLQAVEHVTNSSVALLRRCYNESSSVPINRLHPEILAMVFSFLRRPALPPDTLVTAERPIFWSYRPLLDAMLVCNRWYMIVCQQPSLWTKVDFIHHPSAVRHLLDRSAAASLHLRVTFTGKGKDPLQQLQLSTLKTRVHRLRKLDLSARDTAMMFKRVPLIDVDMPLLRGLLITVGYDDAADVGVFRASPGGRYPNLESMVLKNFVWIPANPIPRLTHLHLGYMEGVSLDDILDLLAHTPVLEYLEIHCSHSEEAVGPGQVTLPQLRTLVMDRLPISAEVLHSFLTRVRLPRIALVTVPSLHIPDAQPFNTLFGTLFTSASAYTLSIPARASTWVKRAREGADSRRLARLVSSTDRTPISSRTTAVGDCTTRMITSIAWPMILIASSATRRSSRCS